MINLCQTWLRSTKTRTKESAVSKNLVARLSCRRKCYSPPLKPPNSLLNQHRPYARNLTGAVNKISLSSALTTDLKDSNSIKIIKSLAGLSSLAYHLCRWVTLNQFCQLRFQLFVCRLLLRDWRLWLHCFSVKTHKAGLSLHHDFNLFDSLFSKIDLLEVFPLWY